MMCDTYKFWGENALNIFSIHHVPPLIHCDEGFVGYVPPFHWFLQEMLVPMELTQT